MGQQNRPPTNRIVYMNSDAPMPYLRDSGVADAFNRLRTVVIKEAGFDFLAKCAEMMRPPDFHSTKIGVANRSRHKCGDAFDYDQTSSQIVVAREDQGTQTFFRTWLKCKAQDGSLGVKAAVKDFRGFTVKEVYLFDFTSAAERIGWKRIPAWRGWSTTGSGYNKMEFWHYQFTMGLSFDEAMAYLYKNLPSPISVKDVRKPSPDRILGINDRGQAVRNIQEKLNKIDPKLLPREEVDGVFGPATQAAVKSLQEKYKLDDDGLVGPDTRTLIDRLFFAQTTTPPDRK